MAVNSLSSTILSGGGGRVGVRLELQENGH